MSTVLLDVSEKVATLTLNRPDARNALNLEMMTSLQNALEELAENSDVQVLVLQGAGKAFCAGADLKEMLNQQKAETTKDQEFGNKLARLLQTLDQFPKPVVIKAHGPVVGGGLGLIATADIVIAEERTFFAFSEVHLGLIPAVISGFVLQRLPLSQARRLMLTGERFSAQQAMQWGLVDHVAAASERATPGDERAEPGQSLEEIFQATLTHLLKGGPAAQSACKSLLQYAQTHSLEQHLEFAATTLTELIHKEEAKSRIEAFFQSKGM